MRLINLIPQEVVAKEARERLRASYLVAGGATIGSLALAYGLIAGMLGYVGGQLTALRAQLPLESAQPDAQLAQVEATLTQWYATHQALAPFVVDRQVYANLLKALTTAVEGRVWLQSLAVNLEEGTCTLSGLAPDQDAVNEFVAALKESPFFRKVDVVSLGRAEDAGAKFETSCLLAIQ